MPVAFLIQTIGVAGQQSPQRPRRAASKRSYRELDEGSSDSEQSDIGEEGTPSDVEDEEEGGSDQDEAGSDAVMMMVTSLTIATPRAEQVQLHETLNHSAGDSGASNMQTPGRVS